MSSSDSMALFWRAISRGCLREIAATASIGPMHSAADGQGCRLRGMLVRVIGTSFGGNVREALFWDIPLLHGRSSIGVGRSLCKFTTMSHKKPYSNYVGPYSTLNKAMPKKQSPVCSHGLRMHEGRRRKPSHQCTVLHSTPGLLRFRD